MHWLSSNEAIERSVSPLRRSMDFAHFPRNINQDTHSPHLQIQANNSHLESDVEKKSSEPDSNIADGSLRVHEGPLGGCRAALNERSTRNSEVRRDRGARR